MSDVSAGPPVAEPVGPPPGPAATDSPGMSDTSGAMPTGAEPRAGRSTATESLPGNTDQAGPPASDDPAGAVDEMGEGSSSPSSPDGPGTGPNPRRRRRRPSGGGSGSDGSGPETLSGDAEEVETGSDPAPSPEEPRPVGVGVERPRIGDTRPAPPGVAPATAKAVTPKPAAPRAPRQSPAAAKASGEGRVAGAPTVPREKNGGRPSAGPAPSAGGSRSGSASGSASGSSSGSADRSASGSAGGAVTGPEVDDDEEGAKSPGGRSRRRSGRERRGRPVGRYLMCVHVRPHATQIAVLEGRTLVEHQVSRAADDATQIDGNIYRGRVQNVLPGMEAAFVDISTPKNAVLYRGDVRFDRDDLETSVGKEPRIEQMLRAGQTILCQVTKNPIGAKGARLTQEVSLPGRFVVMVPNSSAFGISKRLDDSERKRLRRIVDDVRPKGHGLIVRTAAEGASQEELGHDVERLAAQWAAIEAEASRSTAPGLLYREPDLAVRSVREEFNREYRGVVIDDEELFVQVRDYIEQVNPELADRVELYDPVAENMPVFERFHVHEQLHKALDRKVWLPSGGSLIIERTEALTVIDVNTGKNVGTSNLEETVYRNNLEAAEEIARQLRLRDIGGIIVIDFIDMEIRENRDKVASALRSALARDKTRTQVFDISELGLVEMTRKRVSEGLVESLSSICAICGGRGIVLDDTLL
jgi:ribonuclease E